MCDIITSDLISFRDDLYWAFLILATCCSETRVAPLRQCFFYVDFLHPHGSTETCIKHKSRLWFHLFYTFVIMGSYTATQWPGMCTTTFFTLSVPSCQGNFWTQLHVQMDKSGNAMVPVWTWRRFQQNKHDLWKLSILVFLHLSCSDS